ncbi:MAG TPA: DNA recombination protein RmuC [Candidatus Paceibacterota bacterium]
MSTGILAVGALLLGLGLAYLIWGRKKPEVGGKNGGELLLIQNQLNTLAGVLRDMTKEVATVHATNQSVMGVAEQLRSLQNVLQNPKQRGVLGEYYLETVLKNVLPPGSFQLQYKFQDGEIADAVIVLGKDKLLPVDSKFSLENYNRIISTNDQLERERLEKLFKQDLKNRIDETSKYIRPSEGTMDFAFMFIPSEAIYYDLLINQVGAVKSNTKDLIEYAFRDKKVIIVSPTSFMAYLQTVLQGMRAMQIEEKAGEIVKKVGELGRHLSTYDQFMASLGKSLGTTVGHYNKASHELAKIDKDVLKISGEAPGLERQTLDTPQIAEQ